MLVIHDSRVDFDFSLHPAAPPSNLLLNQFVDSQDGGLYVCHNSCRSCHDLYFLDCDGQEFFFFLDTQLSWPTTESFRAFSFAVGVLSRALNSAPRSGVPENRPDRFLISRLKTPVCWRFINYCEIFILSAGLSLIISFL